MSRDLPAPKDGWTCFHCGMVFKTYGEAEDHFGVTPETIPVCLLRLSEHRGMVMTLRKVQAALRELFTVSVFSVLPPKDVLEVLSQFMLKGDVGNLIDNPVLIPDWKGLSDSIREVLPTLPDGTYCQCGESDCKYCRAVKTLKRFARMEK